ncbi:hypothetical protein COB80_02760 [Candidatus Kaiserbacteria bacterium]|nr:MAG: hypothetical protein COB80_02760 [Candidatus Kaiserbacteria bacterium]
MSTFFIFVAVSAVALIAGYVLLKLAAKNLYKRPVLLEIFITIATLLFWVPFYLVIGVLQVGMPEDGLLIGIIFSLPVVPIMLGSIFFSDKWASQEKASYRTLYPEEQ